MRTVAAVRRRRIWAWIERGNRRLPEVELNSQNMWCCPSCGSNAFADGRPPRSIPLLGIGLGMRQLVCTKCRTACRPRPVSW